MRKWILVIILLLISIIVAAFMLNATGVVDLQGLAIDKIETMPAVAPHLETYRAGQSVEEEIAKAQAEIDKERGELIQRQLELDTRAEALAAMEKRLAKSYEEFEEEKTKLLEIQAEIDAAKMGLLELDRLRSIYGEMKSKDAAAIMSQLRPEVIAFLLAEMDPEVASGILANLDPKLAAEITRMALTTKK